MPRWALVVALVGLAASGHAAPPGAGDPPPARVGTTLDGEPSMVALGSGRATVVSFWATWCKYCLNELPILANIQRVVGKDRMQVIAVDVEDRKVFRGVVRALASLDIELAYDPDHAARTAYGVQGIPHMVVIGRDGTIVQVFRGYDESSLDAITAAINRAVAATP